MFLVLFTIYTRSGVALAWDNNLKSELNSNIFSEKEYIQIEGNELRKTTYASTLKSKGTEKKK